MAVSGIKVHSFSQREPYADVAGVQIADVERVLVWKQVAVVEERNATQCIQMKFDVIGIEREPAEWRPRDIRRISSGMRAEGRQRNRVVVIVALRVRA